VFVLSQCVCFSSLACELLIYCVIDASIRGQPYTSAALRDHSLGGRTPVSEVIRNKSAVGLRRWDCLWMEHARLRTYLIMVESRRF